MSHSVKDIIAPKHLRDADIDAVEYESNSLKQLFEYVRKHNALFDFVRDVDQVINKIIAAEVIITVLMLSFASNALLLVSLESKTFHTKVK